MLGPDCPEHIRNVVTDAAGAFKDQIKRDLADLAETLDDEILQMLAEKMAVSMLADQVNDTPGVPYISVWQAGKGEISQIYISPRIIDLLDYSAEEVKKIRYANLAGDRIVNFYGEEQRFEGKTVQRRKARADREKEFLGNRVWKGFYRVRRRDGSSVWVMDKAVLTKFVNEKGNNVVYVSEGILLDAGEMMEKLKGA